MTLPFIHIPREIRSIGERLAKAGKKAYIVGGALRDFCMKRHEANDFDLATDAMPEEIIALFPRVIPTGIKHGTVTVLAGPYSVEITTLRTEEGYSDGRRPDSVRFVSEIEEDLSRRDFTMNSMAYDMATGSLHDPFGGREDINRRRIRCVGEPSLRFREDGLRPLRAIRFASQLGFSIEEKTFAAIPEAIGTFRLVSMERIRDEFQKILLSPAPEHGLGLLERTGLLGVFLPELTAARGCSQKGMHAFDVMDHLFLAVKAAQPDLVLRLAALFHDVGKPPTRALGEDGLPIFYNHEKVSASLAEKALKRLKFPNEVISRVLHLVVNHMFNYGEDWTDAAVRRFIARVGKENIEDLFSLRSADTAATQGLPPDPRLLEPFRSRIALILRGENAFSLKDLKIGGEELAAIGVPRGPAMGKMLNELLETVLDDPDQNKAEVLLAIAAALKPRYGLK